jgi:hypothetical protein
VTLEGGDVISLVSTFVMYLCGYCVCFWCSKLRFDCATSPAMAGEGQYAGRSDCQVCLLNRLLTAVTMLVVIFAGLCISNVACNVNIW